MVKRCSYGGCKTDTRYPERVSGGVEFFPFPKPKTQMQRCLQWIKLCGRPDTELNVSKINKHTYICSKHFVNGRPSPEHPSPTIAAVQVEIQPKEKVKREPRKRKPKPKERRDNWLVDGILPDGKKWEPTTHHDLYSQRSASGGQTSPLHLPAFLCGKSSPKKKRPSCSSLETESIASLDFSVSSDSSIAIEDATFTVHTNRSLQTHCGSQQCTQYFMLLETECQSLRNEIQILREKVSQVDFDELSFVGNDEKVRTLTGFPSFEKMKGVFTRIEGYLRDDAAFSPFQQFVLTLLHLRLNVTLSFLAFLFCVSLSSASSVFHHCLNVMHFHLVPALIRWPGRDVSLPCCFRRQFDSCVAVIDCLEVLIDRPQTFLARSQTSHKSHDTMKYLIAVTPQGAVSFISDGWGGRASDKHIVNNSGFLEKLLPGDVVLGNRGFTVSDSVELYSAERLIPAFTKGKKHLELLDIENGRGLASVRSHVEHVIGQTRKKYLALKGPIPVSLLEGNEQQMMLDKVVHVCCALSNVSESEEPSSNLS